MGKLDSRWPQLGQKYKGDISHIAEMWNDHLIVLKHDQPEITERELKLCWKTFYSAFNSVCLELAQFGFDPEAVGLAVGVWSKEFGQHLDFCVEENEIIDRVEKQSDGRPSKN